MGFRVTGDRLEDLATWAGVCSSSRPLSSKTPMSCACPVVLFAALLRN